MRKIILFHLRLEFDTQETMLKETIPINPQNAMHF
jgi:hypothetical protein